jgi:hypothetical protein
LGGRESGVFTHTFSELISKSPYSTFNDLELYTKKNIKKYQDIQITTLDKNYLNESVLVDAYNFE